MASVHNYIKDAKIGPTVSTRFFFINIGKYVVSNQNTTRFGSSLPDMYERRTHTCRAHNANEQNLTSTLTMTYIQLYDNYIQNCSNYLIKITIFLQSW